MTTNEQVSNQMPERPMPPPMLYTGTHYVKLLLYALAFIFVAVWIFILYAYGFIFQPTATLDNGNYLRTEIAFELIPVLPDTLAEAYDLAGEEQLARISEFQIVNEDGQVAIPFEEALPLFLESEIAVREAPTSGIPAEEQYEAIRAARGQDMSAMAAEEPMDEAEAAEEGAAEENGAATEDESAPAPEATEEASGDE